MSRGIQHNDQQRRKWTEQERYQEPRQTAPALPLREAGIDQCQRHPSDRIFTVHQTDPPAHRQFTPANTSGAPALTHSSERVGEVKASIPSVASDLREK